jgi:hypothetical protein
MNPNIVELRRFFLIVFVLLVTGWAIATGNMHTDLVERGFTLAPTMAWYYPFDLPRWLGLIFYVAVAGAILHAEYHANSSPEDDAMLGIAIAGYCLFVGLTGIVVAVAYWTGAWFSLVLMGIAVWRLAFTMRGTGFNHRVLLVLLGVGCAVGVWTGFINGIVHGLFATIVQLLFLVFNKEERPIRFDALGLTR